MLVQVEFQKLQSDLQKEQTDKQALTKRISELEAQLSNAGSHDAGTEILPGHCCPQ